MRNAASSVLGVATNPDGTRNYGATAQPYQIVGYGNTETGAFSDPPLTTIEHRVSDNGRLLGQLLLDRLADRLPAVCHHLEPVELVPRDSDGPLSSF